MIRIPSGSSDRKIAFVAVDSTDLKTRETGLTTFTVYRSRNGGTATAYTTPTVAELSAANMPGVYVLTIDEDTTLDAGHDTEEYVVHITQAAMAPVTRAIEIFRPKFTEGQTATMANSAVDADIERLQGSVIATPTVAGVLEVDVTHWLGTAAATPTVAGVPEVDITHIAGSAVSTSSAQLGVNVVNAAGTAWNSGAIGAATLAADTITAAKVAADVSAEIADAVWDEAASGHVTIGTFGDYANFSEVLVRTTIATLASQTSFTLTAGSADNDAYNGCVIVIQDVTTAAQKAVGVVSDYVGATKTVTLLNDPAVFTMAATDLVTIVADRALKATVDNRTLDVSATGEAGLDWANIGSPTTAQNLSATNIDVDQVVASVSGAVGSVTGSVGSVTGLTAATVHSDLDDIQARLPAALVGGRMDSSVGAMAAGVVTAAAVATGAIDADALATDAVTEITDATKTALGITTGTADSGTTTTMVDAALTQADTDYWKGAIIVFTSGTISGQARLVTGFTPASDTVTFAPATTQAVGTNTYIIIPAGRVDVNSWLGSTAATPSLPGVPEVDLTYVNGFVADSVPFAGTLNANVTGIDSNVITAASIAADAITAAKVAADVGAEIADAVWDEATSGHVTAGTFGQRLYGIRSGTAQAGAGTTITLDASASAVDNFYNNCLIVITGGTGAGQSRFITGYVGATKVATVGTWATNPDATSVFVVVPFDTIPGASAPTAAQVADAVWDEDATAHQTAGTFGQAIGDPGADANTIYGAVVTGAAGATIAADIIAVQADTDDIQTRLPAALVGGRMDASVGAMAAGVVTAAAVATGAIDADALATDAANEIADALLDRAAGVETGMTMRQALRVITAALAGKLSGAATTTITIRDVNDSVDRITATVTADGNRTAVTLNTA